MRELLEACGHGRKLVEASESINAVERNTRWSIVSPVTGRANDVACLRYNRQYANLIHTRGWKE